MTHKVSYFSQHSSHLDAKNVPHPRDAIGSSIAIFHIIR